MRPSINLCPYCDIVLPLWVSGKAGRPINTHSLLGKASCVVFSMGICDASRFHISMPNTKRRVACISVSVILCLFIVIGSDNFYTEWRNTCNIIKMVLNALFVATIFGLCKWVRNSQAIATVCRPILSSSLPLARPNRVGMQRSRSRRRTSDATRVPGEITIIIDHRASVS